MIPKRSTAVLRSTLLFVMLACLPGPSPAQSLAFLAAPREVACITFSTGLTGHITYDPFLDTSRTAFSDGTWSRTNHTEFGSNTLYSDGRTAHSTFSEFTNRVSTTFSDGVTAVTTFNEFANTVVTTFSTGERATIKYVEAVTWVESPVCGLFLMPGRSNIIVDPKHPAVQEIRRLRALTPEQRNAAGWMRSGG